MRRSVVWVWLLVVLLSIGAFAAAAQAGTVSSGDVMDVTSFLPGPKAGRFVIDDAGDLTLNIQPPGCSPSETLNLFVLCDLVAFIDIPDATLDASGKFVGTIPAAFPPDAADSCPVPVVLGFGISSGCLIVNGH